MCNCQDAPGPRSTRRNRVRTLGGGGAPLGGGDRVGCSAPLGREHLDPRSQAGARPCALTAVCPGRRRGDVRRRPRTLRVVSVRPAAQGQRQPLCHVVLSGRRVDSATLVGAPMAALRGLGCPHTSRRPLELAAELESCRSWGEGRAVAPTCLSGVSVAAEWAAACGPARRVWERQASQRPAESRPRSTIRFLCGPTATRHSEAGWRGTLRPHPSGTRRSRGRTGPGGPPPCPAASSVSGSVRGQPATASEQLSRAQQ